jgi:plasmid replication initiation protein
MKTTIFKKHSATIQMNNKLSLNEIKSFNFLLLEAQNQLKNEPKKESFEVSLQDIKRNMDIKSTNNQPLKKSLKNLADTSLELNIFNKNKSTSWIYMSLLAYCEINDGTVIFDFNFKIRQMLLNPDMFSIFDILILKQFNSKYSTIIYEFIEDYKKVSIPTMSIDEFKNLLGLDKDKYKNFADLRIRIIEPAIKEIEAKTNILISYETTKRGRKVTHIKLRVSEKSRDMLIAPKESLAQFVNRVKKRFRGRRFVKPRYLGFERYLRTTTFMIDYDTSLVKNYVSGKIVEKEEVEELFSRLYEDQKYLGEVEERAGDYIDRTIEIKQTVTSPLGTLEEVSNKYQIIELVKSDKKIDLMFTYQFKVKHKVNGKEGLVPAQPMIEPQLIKSIKKYLD